MNSKKLNEDRGFTLIELLAVIVIISVVLAVVGYSAINSYIQSKEKAYTILIGNIKTAGILYYQECEYGDTISKYEKDACQIDENTNSTTVTLGRLAELGFLKGGAEKNTESDTYEYKTIKNPKTGQPISECEIIITKNANDKLYSYSIKNNSNQDFCPTDTDYN